MYLPKHFAIDDPEWIRRFVDRHRFATVVTMLDGAPFATHLPLLFEGGIETGGVLRGHIARANPQWRSFAESSALAIFAGPHAYVSPTWYRTSEPAVPTWNYTAVHASGRARVIEEPATIYDLLDRLAEREEAPSPEPWRLAALDGAYRESMMRQIVAFELPVTRWEAKAKLSQNRVPQERRLVANALGGELAALMDELAITP